MFPLQLMNFCLAVRSRGRHIAKCADGIYRLIWIDAVEELVIVHSPTCIVGLHDWISKGRGCTAFGQTEVASPQSAFQQQIPSHPALSLAQPKHSSGPMKRVASAAFSLTLRTTNRRKTLRSPCAKPAELARRRRHPHKLREHSQNHHDTFRPSTQSKGQTGPVNRL